MKHSALKKRVRTITLIIGFGCIASVLSHFCEGDLLKSLIFTKNTLYFIGTILLFYTDFEIN